MPPGDPDYDHRLRYQHELPDKSKLAKAWKLLEGYSGIPEDEIEPHVRRVVGSHHLFRMR